MICHLLLNINLLNGIQSFKSVSNKPLYNVRLLAQEYEPDPNWKMPEVPASDIYDISIFQFKATTLIRYCSVNVRSLLASPCINSLNPTS
jgi:hypothetical protein